MNCRPKHLTTIASRVEKLMYAHAAGARLAKAELVAEWEQLEADECAHVLTPAGGASNGEVAHAPDYAFVAQRATRRPTKEESAAFLEAEREQLGIDRVTLKIRGPS